MATHTQTPTSSLGWLRKFHKPQSTDNPPLVICPHAGGGASTYRPFSKELSQYFDVVTVQYPGRQDRAAETPKETLPELAQEAFAEFSRSYTSGVPITVFGHSMGAVVAFEFARLAEEAGVPVRLLAVSGAVAPWRVVDMPSHPTGDEELLDHVAGLDGTGSAVLGNRDLMRMALPALKADYSAFDRYTSTKDVTLTTPITALGGSDDDFVAIGDLYGWQEHTEHELRVTLFDGGHFYLHDNVSGITELLSAGLATPAAAAVSR